MYVSSDEVFNQFYGAVKHYRDSGTTLERNFMKRVWANVDVTEAQLFQDCFVLAVLGKREPRTFCEIGAADGRWLSNSYMLEQYYKWTGILVEPGRTWHADLWQNRPEAVKDTRCVWSESGSDVAFVETDKAEFSTIQDFLASDFHGHRRSNVHERYKVRTISLHDLVAEHGFTNGINYLSVDTEGSEYEILKNVDLNALGVKVLTVEHNFGDQEPKLDKLLAGQGYERWLKSWSRWDAWYLHRSVARRFRK